MDKKTQEKLVPVTQQLVQNIHYYFNEKGFMVFTELYHQARGYCCKNGCKHCPFGYKK
ncbi:MAG: DUF5522 domain-containing protein [Bacteroidia bacterium]